VQPEVQTEVLVQPEVQTEVLVQPEVQTEVLVQPETELQTEVESEVQTEVQKKKVLTEDLGKIFEMAICLEYKTEYDGKYKYSMDEAIKMSKRIKKLKDIFPYKLKHTAKNGGQYDFTNLEGNIHLSAKTNKNKNGKVAPQVIGQPTKKKFCEFFSLDFANTSEQLKKYIEENVKIMLKIYFDFTFNNCNVIYYVKKTDKLLLIKKKTDIDWNIYTIEFRHLKKNKIWNEGSTISINNISIGEFQFHNHRDCIKFRWIFEKILTHFSDCFEITTL
jgi:hypothetical protein